MKRTFFFLFLALTCVSVYAQNTDSLTVDRVFNSREFSQERLGTVYWMDKGKAYLLPESSKELPGGRDLVRYDCESGERSVWVSALELIPSGSESALPIASFSLSPDERKLLIFTNTRRVWRSNTKGDYWVYDLDEQELKRLGESLPEASLMFAKFSPDNKQVAYVSDFNLFVEDYATGKVTQLTFLGNEKIINGTFDWAYEEELGCRDGFRWSPDGKHIAFWQLDASDIGEFYMINNTDSLYPKIIPVQYPKVGQKPSAARVAYIDMATGKTEFIPVPGGEKENYLPRMQWMGEGVLLITQVNRRQDELKIWRYELASGEIRTVYEEKDEAWVDVDYPDVTANNWGMEDMIRLEGGKYFIRMNEVDGWRHAYKVSAETGEKVLLTPGAYDLGRTYDADGSYLYFIASPYNGTQRYLYRVSLDGSGDTLRLTPKEFSGVNQYNFSPGGEYAIHAHQNANSPSTTHLIRVNDHKRMRSLVSNSHFRQLVRSMNLPQWEFFSVTTEDGISIDGKMLKPGGFDPDKKYPVFFYVYGEPWGMVASDTWGNMWHYLLAQKGYVVIAMDNRGTPCLKGREWRRSLFGKVGILNARDQAMAAREVLKWDFLDPERVAVQGHSGGGSMTLNLMFRYPEIYKTGMAGAAVANQLYYDNIYQERYMGQLPEALEDYVKGSPLSVAKNLEGNLLIVHGTADDNVHYQNAEALINELILHNKQFSMMSYPNRSHGIYEGVNTRRHLYTLYTNFLLTHCPPGGR